MILGRLKIGQRLLLLIGVGALALALLSQFSLLAGSVDLISAASDQILESARDSVNAAQEPRQAANAIASQVERLPVSSRKPAW